MNPLIISRLIESGYQIFFPLHDDSELLLRNASGSILSCGARNACQDGDKSPLLKSVEGYDVVAVCDQATSTVWIIPSEILESRTSVRLGRKYDDYIIPPPSSLTYQEQRIKREILISSLKEKAREVGEKKGSSK